MTDQGIIRRTAAARGPHGRSAHIVDLLNAPDDSLSNAELITIRRALEGRRPENADDRTLAQWTMGAVGCYKEKALERLDNWQEALEAAAAGPPIPQDQQRAMSSMINTVMRATQHTPDGRIPIVTHDGLPATMSAQDMARIVTAGVQMQGLSQQERIAVSLQKLLAQAFFGTGARGVGTLASGIRRVSDFIANFSDTIVSPLPASQQDNGKLVISAGMYVLFYYYLLPLLATKAFSTMVDCSSDACAKVSEAVGGMCTMMGGKRKSRRHRGHKKRKSRKASKSRKGRKSPKRKVKRGKTHKRKARKGRKSHKRKH